MAGVAVGGILAIAWVSGTGPAGIWRAAGFAAQTHAPVARTGSPDLPRPSELAFETVVASPPASPARISRALPTCATGEPPYPQSAPLAATRPATMYFHSDGARSGWLLDIPDLGIKTHGVNDPFRTIVLLYARDYTNSQAGAHTATLTWPSASGEQDCRYPFWLKRNSGLSMTVTSVGGTRRLTGRLTWTSFGPHPSTVGHPGQTIRIRYHAHKDVSVGSVTTDGDGRFALTIRAGLHTWQATYTGIPTANGISTVSITG